MLMGTEEPKHPEALSEAVTRKEHVIIRPPTRVELPSVRAAARPPVPPSHEDMRYRKHMTMVVSGLVTLISAFVALTSLETGHFTLTMCATFMTVIGGIFVVLNSH